MKYLITIFFLSLSVLCNSQILGIKTVTTPTGGGGGSDSSVTTLHTYYVTSGGSNSNNGLTPATAFQTISHACSVLVNGDSVLTRNGVCFRDDKIILSGGINHIYFGTYGTGSDTATLNGGHLLPSWTSLGGHLYKTSFVNDSNNTVKYLSIDGQLQEIGRWPKAGLPKNGYLHVSAVTSTSITADFSTSPTADWTGATTIQKNGYQVSGHIKVLSQTGNTIQVGGTNLDATYGELIMTQHIACLTGHGDWMYDSAANEITVYLDNPPSNYVIEAGYEENLVLLDNANYIKFDGIKFKGANRNAFQWSGCSHDTITNCSVYNNGKNGLKFSYPMSNNWAVLNSKFRYNQSGDILQTFFFSYQWGYVNPAAHDIAINGNDFFKTAPFPANSNQGEYEIMLNAWFFVDEPGIFTRNSISLGTNSTYNVSIQNNHFNHTAFQQLRFHGEHYLISGNYFENGMEDTFDGGLANTWNVAYAGIERIDDYDREICFNVFRHSDGLENPSAAMSVYLDDGTNGINCHDNTFLDGTGFAFNAHNASNFKFKNNLICNQKNINAGSGYVNETGQIQFGHDFVDTMKVRNAECDSNVTVNKNDTLNNVFLVLSDIADYRHEESPYAHFDSMATFNFNKLYKLTGSNSNMYQTMRPDSLRYTEYFTPSQFNTLQGYNTNSTVSFYDLSNLLVLTNNTRAAVVQSLAAGTWRDIKILGTGDHTSTITIPALGAIILLKQ